MSAVVFVSRDAAALAVGADKVARAIEQEAAKRGIDVTFDMLRNEACAVLKAYGESGLVY